jgi:hypothetical protein
VQSWRSQNEVKATLSERKILDIKRKLSKYMYHNNTKNWINAYQDVIDSLNNSVNRNLKMKPVDVKTFEDERRAFMNLYGKRLGIRPPEPRLDVGSRVRLSHLHNKFKKSYLQNYTTEKFVISKVLPREGQNLYQVEDSDGERIIGNFYKKELQPAEEEEEEQAEEEEEEEQGVAVQEEEERVQTRQKKKKLQNAGRVPVKRPQRRVPRKRRGKF